MNNFQDIGAEFTSAWMKHANRNAVSVNGSYITCRDPGGLAKAIAVSRNDMPGDAC